MGLVADLAASGSPLTQQLEALSDAAPRSAKSARTLRTWGKRSLGLRGASLKDWTERAWWGVVAGELVRAHLGDKELHIAAGQIFDPGDLSEIQEAQRQGGVILATAHLGPPKAAMNFLIQNPQFDDLLIWTNFKDLPTWLPSSTDTKLLNPLAKSERAALLITSALHLRAGGVLFAAPDFPSGKRTIELQEFKRTWRFSLGIAELQRRLELPAFLLLALWVENRIRIVAERLPEPNLTDASDYNQQWIENYWSKLSPIVASSPENLRFLLGSPGVRKESLR